MSLTHITTAVDHAQYMKGDVVIIKRSYVLPTRLARKRGEPQLQTVCTKCGKLFPTIFRRMKPGTCEVRNVPRCARCRHQPYIAQDAAQQELPL